MAETIEGLADTHITYNLKASVTRGKLAHDLHAWRPVRIVRTLSQTVLERAGSVTVEDIWANKIEYQIIIPRKDVVFGTEIVLEMTLTPLLKGLRIGTITCDLYEHQELAPLETHLDAESCSRVVDSWDFELNDGEHFLQKLLSLPKQLSKCLQDAEVCGIKIWHEVKLNIALHNPDGHISDVSSLGHTTK
jgi:arrestin-related trafficking adapter 4/5/7